MIKKLTPIIAILAIAGLEVYAMSQGIDGVALGGVVAIIAGLGGYTAHMAKTAGKGNGSSK